MPDSIDLSFRNHWILAVSTLKPTACIFKCIVCPGEGSGGNASILKSALNLATSCEICSVDRKGGMETTSDCRCIFSKPGPGSTTTFIVMISCLSDAVFMTMESLPSPETDLLNVSLIYH